MSLNAFHRTETLQKAEHTEFDLVVIGGGITGAGIALDASLRGLKVLLVERYDFAFGTSSRSTKLIHGGLRYLKNLEFQLVRLLGIERAIVHNLAPHLTIPEKMLTPIVQKGTYGKSLTAIGIGLYDYLAKVRPSERRIMLNTQQTALREPLLRTDILKGSALYYEYRTDDARLTIELIKTAQANGAICLNYLEATAFIYNNHQIAGLTCVDHRTKSICLFKAKVVVNAAGPWVDALRAVNKSLQGKHLMLTKGVHIVVPYQRLPVAQALYFDVFDGRMIFVIPRETVTYIGTTDTPYTENADTPYITQQDAAYLIHAVNQMMPEVHLTENDIVSGWVGLRPLIFEPGKSASEISRKDEIFESASGLLSIAGGKLTGYRKMSEKVVDKALKRLKRPFKASRTSDFKLLGGAFPDYDHVQQYILKLTLFFRSHFENPEPIAKRLVHLYGTHCDKILEGFITERTHNNPEQALLIAELQYTILNESVHTLTDFTIRRSGLLYFQIEILHRNLPVIRQHLQLHFAYTDTEMERQQQELDKAIEQILGYLQV